MSKLAPDSLPHIEIARVLAGDLVGGSLLDQLRSQFGGAGREEVFLGVTLAFSVLKADLFALSVELAVLKRSCGEGGE